jgi:hypothetical protein
MVLMGPRGRGTLFNYLVSRVPQHKGHCFMILGGDGDVYALMRFFHFSNYRASRILAEWHIMGQELKRGLHVVQNV